MAADLVGLVPADLVGLVPADLVGLDTLRVLVSLRPEGV
jgi:hypothetical protein